MSIKRSIRNLLRFFIIIFCIVAFSMAYTNQISFSYYTSHFGILSFTVSSNNLFHSYFSAGVTSYVGYIFFLITAILFCFSCFFSFTKLRRFNTFIDIFALLFLLTGIILVGIIPVIYQDEYLGRIATNVIGVGGYTADDVSLYTLTLLSGPITALCLSCTSFILGVLVIFFEYSLYRNERKARQAEKAEISKKYIN